MLLFYMVLVGNVRFRKGTVNGHDLLFDWDFFQEGTVSGCDRSFRMLMKGCVFVLDSTKTVKGRAE